MHIANHKIVLKQPPVGLPKTGDFDLVTEDLRDPVAGEVVVEVEHLGIDAFIATTLNHDGWHGKSELQAPVIAVGTGRVIESRSDDLQVGDYVIGGLGAQRYAIQAASQCRKLDTQVASPKAYLGLLGVTTGLTAYAGMLLVGDVQEGDTVAVSAAAGAVGTVACQLARIRGAHVIGIAGGPEKCEFLKSIGCDAAIDYKNSDVNAQLKVLAPNGLDLFFDNVGGDILDCALDNIASEARVVICGAISQYGDMTAVRGPSMYLRLAERNATLRGFTVDHYESQFPRMQTELAAWEKEGRLQLPEHIESGIDNFPETLLKLYSGGHRGKLLLTP